MKPACNHRCDDNFDNDNEDYFDNSDEEEDGDACCPSSSSVSVSSIVMIGRELPSPPVNPPHVTSSTPPYLMDHKMKI